MIRAYHLVLRENIIHQTQEMLDDYKFSVTLGEKKHNLIYRLVFKEIKANLKDISPNLKQLLNVINDIYQIIIKFNIRLIIAVVKKKYLNKGLSMLELVMEGVFSLIKTINKFDYSKKFKFSTYCIHWLHQSLYKSINNANRTVTLPMHIISSMKKTSNIFEKMTDNEKITPQEERKLKRIHFLPKKKVILELQNEDQDNDTPSLQDSLIDVSVEETDKNIEFVLENKKIKKILNKLSPVEERFARYILGMYFGDPVFDNELILSKYSHLYSVILARISALTNKDE